MWCWVNDVRIKNVGWTIPLTLLMSEENSFKKREFYYILDDLWKIMGLWKLNCAELCIIRPETFIKEVNRVSFDFMIYLSRPVMLFVQTKCLHLKPVYFLKVLTFIPHKFKHINLNILLLAITCPVTNFKAVMMQFKPAEQKSSVST